MFILVVQEVKAVNQTVVGVRTQREKEEEVEDEEELGNPGQQVAANQRMWNRKRTPLYVAKRLSQRLPEMRRPNIPRLLFLWPPWQQRLRWPPADLLPHLRPKLPPASCQSFHLTMDAKPPKALWWWCHVVSDDVRSFVLFSVNHSRTIISKLFLIRLTDMKFRHSWFPGEESLTFVIHWLFCLHWAFIWSTVGHFDIVIEIQDT